MKRKLPSSSNSSTSSKMKKRPKKLEFSTLSAYRKAELLELLQWLAIHPTHARTILAIASKEHYMAQRVIEHTQTTYAKKYNLILNTGQFDVRQRFKSGPRKDPNCRGEWFPIYFEDSIYLSTPRQLHSLKFLVAEGSQGENVGPLYKFIAENYEIIKNDLNFSRDLTPQKKDISKIPRPRYQSRQPAAFWNFS